jgi:GNAT superfamily N-acetyltransferase
MTFTIDAGAARPAVPAIDPALGTARDRAFLIAELTEQSLAAVRTHLLALDTDDRRMRFGHAVHDRTIEHYVNGSDFERDRLFGIHVAGSGLIAVGHLAMLTDDSPERATEFAVSVLPAARGRGIGGALFDHAVRCAREMGLSRFYMHFLSHNHAMLYIARKAGMAVHSSYGEATASLTLAPMSNAANKIARALN